MVETKVSDGAEARQPTGVGRITVLATPGFAGYRLVDSGAGRKLERFGDVLVDRPEPQALWQPALESAEWRRAHAVFSASAEDEEKGRWRIDRPLPESWPVAGEGIRMLCRMGGIWHLGLFPEQLPHWRWMVDRLRAVEGERPRVLNLFAYTGAASLIAAAAGAEVTHVDASKKAVQWARDNQAASGLGDKPIRWLIDDALKFTAREVRRGRTYHVILVDPPKFGRGPAGETFELFEHLPRLLSDCAALLAPGNSALVLTVYAIRASVLAFAQLAAERLAPRVGTLEAGELVLVPEHGTNRVPTSHFVRWRSGASAEHGRS
jgi:23S rRNA (cytosine1962-C5)-methyltransferase